MKVMISQPMNGRTNKQIREERAELVKRLEEEGHNVVDTVFAEEPSKDSDTGMWYLVKSIEAMSKVDAVYFMRGWENARGCKIEHEVATAYGKKMFYANN